MDKSLFTSPTGELVQIDRPAHPQGKDWAFVPHELPAKWDFDPALWPLLTEARDRLGTLNGIGQTLDDPELLLQPLRNREAITSSMIEGTFVTAEKLLLYEMDPKEPRSKSDVAADWMEVFNYTEAMRVGCEMLQVHSMNSHVVRSMHSRLMSGVRGMDKSPGQFRRQQVQIGSNARFIAPPWAEIDRLMANLEKYIATDETDLDPLVRCFIVHYQFETIHPFEDGNGRVGRLLLALMIYRVLGHHKPWLYLSAFFDRFKDEYFENLFRVSATGEWSRWIEFCLRATLAQASDAIDRCRRFKELKIAYKERMTTPTARSHSIIDNLFRSPIVRVASIKEQFEIHYQTAQAELERLEACGILRQLSKIRPKTYYAHEIMAIAYQES